MLADLCHSCREILLLGGPRHADEKLLPLSHQGELSCRVGMSSRLRLASLHNVSDAGGKSGELVLGMRNFASLISTRHPGRNSR